MNKRISVILYKIYSCCINSLRSSRSINNIVFSFEPSSIEFNGYWDWTTIALRDELKRKFCKGMAYLDMGTGPYATLTMYVLNRLGGDNITASDYIEELLTAAKSQCSSHAITFIISDLFENISGTYDIISFNAPYMVDDHGEKLGLLKDNLARKRFFGGKNGVDVISKFLYSLSDHLRNNGICLLGVNHFHIKHRSIMEAIDAANLVLIGKRRNLLTKSCVYTITKKAKLQY